MLPGFMFFHRERVEYTKWTLPKGAIAGSELILRFSLGIIFPVLHLALILFSTHLVGMGFGIQTER